MRSTIFALIASYSESLISPPASEGDARWRADQRLGVRSDQGENRRSHVGECGLEVVAHGAVRRARLPGSNEPAGDELRVRLVEKITYAELELGLADVSRHVRVQQCVRGKHHAGLVEGRVRPHGIRAHAHGPEPVSYTH